MNIFRKVRPVPNHRPEIKIISNSKGCWFRCLDCARPRHGTGRSFWRRGDSVGHFWHDESLAVDEGFAHLAKEHELV